MASSARRVARRMPSVVLCALAAHTVLYRSLWPADGVHGYFTWYAPAVGVLALVSIVVLPLLVAVALAGAPAGRWLRAVAPSAQGTLAREAAGLGCGALAALVMQESVERSLHLAQPALLALSPFQWGVVLLAIAAVSLAVAWAGRAVSVLAEAIAGRTQERWRPVREQGALPRVSWPFQLRPLAVHGGLRAPPFLR